MTDTVFADEVTVVRASWLNEINDHVHNDTPISPAATVHAASLISNVPTGTIAATDVQTAIDEIVSDNAASSGSSLIGFIQAGTGAVARTGQDELRDSVKVVQFGAVGDGATDDSTAIQAAIDYAATLTSRHGPEVIVDLVGKTYGLGSGIFLVQKEKVIIANGKLLALSGISSSAYLVTFGDGTTNGRSDGAYLRNVDIDCNFLCNAINWNGNTGGRNSNVTVHGYITYGIRVHGNGGSTNWTDIKIAKYWYGETGYDLKANRTGKGFSLEDADHVLTRVNSSYTGTPFYASGFYNTQISDCHFFNSAPSDQIALVITAAADNGSAQLRATVADTTGIANGDLIIVPYLDGISDAGGSTMGVYSASAVTGTTIDFVGYIFAGTWTGASAPVLRRLDEECISAEVAATAYNVLFDDCYFDKGKVRLHPGCTTSLNDSLFVTGTKLENRVGVEIYNDAGSSVDLAGISIKSNSFDASTVRLLKVNSGTYASKLKLDLKLNNRDTGQPVAATGQTVTEGGTVALPSIVFTTTTSGTDQDFLVVDTDTGFYHPNEDEVGLATGGNTVWLADANRMFTLAGSLARPIPVTTTSATLTVGKALNNLICNRSAGTVTLTLPTAATYPGREITVKTTQANTVISVASDVVPLVGGAAGTAILVATAGKWAKLISDGTNWIIMEAN